MCIFAEIQILCLKFHLNTADFKKTPKGTPQYSIAEKNVSRINHVLVPNNCYSLLWQKTEDDHRALSTPEQQISWSFIEDFFFFYFT